jgi:hypothetical protein
VVISRDVVFDEKKKDIVLEVSAAEPIIYDTI